MPSGKTHDSITFLLAVPTWLLAWRLSGSFSLATISSLAFLFGGLMFGPDLDTKSVQFGRWGVFKVFWQPYRLFFRHRSFWTHGLMFGTLLRIVYFLGVATLFFLGAIFIASFVWNGSPPGSLTFMSSWRAFGDYLRGIFGPYLFYSVFAGLWVGAASHSLSDWALSYIKTGKT